MLTPTIVWWWLGTNLPSRTSHQWHQNQDQYYEYWCDNRHPIHRFYNNCLWFTWEEPWYKQKNQGHCQHQHNIWSMSIRRPGFTIIVPHEGTWKAWENWKGLWKGFTMIKSKHAIARERFCRLQFNRTKGNLYNNKLIIHKIIAHHTLYIRLWAIIICRENEDIIITHTKLWGQVWHVSRQKKKKVWHVSCV